MLNNLKPNELSIYFWSEKVWLPTNTTWDILESNNFRHFNDIYYSLITALLLIVIRPVLQNYIYSPIAIYLGLRPTPDRSEPNNAILDNAFRGSKGKLNDKQIEGLAKQLDWTQRQVERWVRQKRTQNKATLFTKFKESAFKLNIYFLLFFFGLYALWDRPWMWDSMYLFIDYPNHKVSSVQWFYYNFECGLYLSLLLTQFFEVKRKDFWIMFVHHIITIGLIVISWASNLVRVGTLGFLIHDLADIPLELTKIMIYLKKQRLAIALFIVFTICWIVCRLLVFPYRIIYYTSYKSLVPMFATLCIINVMLCILLTLHIMWTWFIVRIAVNALKNNTIEKDMRSDDESSDNSSKGLSDQTLNGYTKTV